MAIVKSLAAAAAGAALVGSVNAANHHKHRHAHVARDDTWADWEAAGVSSTTTTVAAPATSTTWAEWEATTTTTTTKPVDPASSSTWADWEEATTTVTVSSTVTTTKYVAPADETETWGDWASTTAAPVTTTTTKPVPAIETVTSVEGWSSAGWFGPSWSVEAGQCAISVITSYGLPTWYPVPGTETATETATWGDWTSSSVAEAPATETTTWADWTSSSVAEAPATETTTWADWTSSSVAEAPATETTTWADWGSSSASVSVPATSTATGGGSKPTGGNGGHPGITPNGNYWGLTYSPYTSNGGCKDAGTVAKDLAIIAKKGFSTVRVYSTDCDTLENIGKSARDNGLKLIIGVWINASGFDAAQGQVDAITKWAQWDLVELIVVGNEVIFNGIASASDLAGFISKCKWAFSAAGYTGPVTTTEPLSVWEDTKNAGVLGGAIDVVGANLYAFFNAQISADKAGSFIQAQINILNSIFAGKSIYVLESGWPHSGNANGAAVPSPENQAIALKGIQAAVGAQVVFLSYEDEPWKEGGQFGVEPFWGCVNVF